MILLSKNNRQTLYLNSAAWSFFTALRNYFSINVYVRPNKLLRLAKIFFNTRCIFFIMIGYAHLTWAQGLFRISGGAGLWYCTEIDFRTSITGIPFGYAGIEVNTSSRYGPGATILIRFGGASSEKRHEYNYDTSYFFDRDDVNIFVISMGPFYELKVASRMHLQFGASIDYYFVESKRTITGNYHLSAATQEESVGKATIVSSDWFLSISPFIRYRIGLKHAFALDILFGWTFVETVLPLEYERNDEIIGPYGYSYGSEAPYTLKGPLGEIGLVYTIGTRRKRQDR